jgi:hypothetical protein
MSEQGNPKRPNYLGQPPTVAGTAAGLVFFFTYASILTPVVFFNRLKTLFGGASNPSPSDPNKPEINLNQTLISEWGLKKIIKPMIAISHVNIEWSQGPIPKTFLFNAHQLSLLHARAEIICINASAPEKEIKIARAFMDYITREGHRKENDIIVGIKPDEKNLG